MREVTVNQKIYLMTLCSYTEKEVSKLTYEEAWELIANHKSGKAVKPPHIIKEERKALKEAEAKKVKISLTNKKYNAGVITIRFNKIPSNCEDCPLYQWNESYDEDAFFGDGTYNSCPFGASHYGCAVKRPKNCPIKVEEVKNNENA
jgi:hypothetical protein